MPRIGATGLPAVIPGAPPRLDRPITGCSFRPRCGVAVAACAEQRPPLLGSRPDCACACHVVNAPAQRGPAQRSSHA
jgi:oligopeptide/dipeptide ABC transporter ATP-binding protein